uniref:Si:dkeyp-75b4.8 n=1 Tax=Scleropages formosus TaxID=113540 RepID=A0A8C9RF78_SCLFO
MSNIPSANLPPSYLETVASGPPATQPQPQPYPQPQSHPQPQPQPYPQPQSQPQPQPQSHPQPQSQPQPQPQSHPQLQPQLELQPQLQVVPTYIVTTQAQTQGVLFCGNLGGHPCQTTCTNCQQKITTRVIYKPGAFSWLMCFVFVILGLFCGCCLIPFFVDSFEDAHHSCPLCHAHLHVHKRM